MADNTGKKSTYNYEAQKKYNANSIHIGLKFIASEKETVEKINYACNKMNVSKQKFIKDAIIEKLEREGFCQ